MSQSSAVVRRRILCPPPFFSLFSKALAEQSKTTEERGTGSLHVPSMQTFLVWKIMCIYSEGASELRHQSDLKQGDGECQSYYVAQNDCVKSLLQYVTFSLLDLWNGCEWNSILKSFSNTIEN